MQVTQTRSVYGHVMNKRAATGAKTSDTNDLMHPCAYSLMHLHMHPYASLCMHLGLVQAPGLPTPTTAPSHWSARRCASPQHGLSSNKMARITSDCDAMRTHEHQMGLITSDCDAMRAHEHQMARITSECAPFTGGAADL